MSVVGATKRETVNTVHCYEEMTVATADSITDARPTSTSSSNLTQLIRLWKDSKISYLFLSSSNNRARSPRRAIHFLDSAPMTLNNFMTCLCM
jgi:hypothetical protein